MTQPVTGTFRSAWQTYTAYHVNDLVTYRGVQYVVTATFASTDVFDSTKLSAVDPSVVREGTNARMGLAVLAASTVTVITTAVTANSRIFLTANVPGGTPASCGSPPAPRAPRSPSPARPAPTPPRLPG